MWARVVVEVREAMVEGSGGGCVATGRVRVYIVGVVDCRVVVRL